MLCYASRIIVEPGRKGPTSSATEIITKPVLPQAFRLLSHGSNPFVGIQVDYFDFKLSAPLFLR